MKPRDLNYILLALLFVAVMVAVFLFNSKKKADTSYSIEKARVAVLLDSLSNDRLSRQAEQKIFNFTIDSLSTLYSKSQVALSKSKSDYSSLLAKYRVTSASGVDSISIADCDEVVDAADKHINNLNTSLTLCDSLSQTKSLLITSLNSDISSYSRSLVELQTFSNNQNVLINSYIKKQNSWWQKNKFWVGFISGALVSSATAIGLSQIK